jgi:hypothetical protein
MPCGFRKNSVRRAVSWTDTSVHGAIAHSRNIIMCRKPAASLAAPGAAARRIVTTRRVAATSNPAGRDPRGGRSGLEIAASPTR